MRSIEPGGVWPASMSSSCGLPLSRCRTAALLASHAGLGGGCQPLTAAMQDAVELLHCQQRCTGVQQCKAHHDTATLRSAQTQTGCRCTAACGGLAAAPCVVWGGQLAMPHCALSPIG